MTAPGFLSDARDKPQSHVGCLESYTLASNHPLTSEQRESSAINEASHATSLILQVYPQRPYYEGRWQDGPAWIEHAAKRLDSRLFDYGSGGSTTGTIPAQVPPLPVGFAGLTLPTTVLSPNLFQQVWKSRALHDALFLVFAAVYMMTTLPQPLSSWLEDMQIRAMQSELQ